MIQCYTFRAFVPLERRFRDRQSNFTSGCVSYRLSIPQERGSGSGAQTFPFHHCLWHQRAIFVNLMTLSVVVLLNHSVFILCESRFCNQVQNIFIVAATIYSMMADSSYWHYASLCERFLIQQWPSILLLWWKADDILLLWHYHSTTGWSFYENSWKTFLFVTMLRQHATHSRPFMVKAENLFIVQCEWSFYRTKSFLNSQMAHLLLSRFVVMQDLVIFMASIMTMRQFNYCEMVQLYTFHCKTIKANKFYEWILHWIYKPYGTE